MQNFADVRHAVTKLLAMVTLKYSIDFILLATHKRLVLVIRRVYSHVSLSLIHISEPTRPY